MRSTLQQQLSQPEYETIKQVVSGELNAVDAFIQEFIHTFELHEAPDVQMDQTLERNEDEDSHA
ncbi:hypothetical protein [Paenibacillus montanisoli]|nr:hypothetical protein [Paenibacillus montanisoli]